ncbi:MAG: hypothetical protein ACLRX5_09535 [Slackia sp.]
MVTDLNISNKAFGDFDSPSAATGLCPSAANQLTPHSAYAKLPVDGDHHVLRHGMGFSYLSSANQFEGSCGPS